MLCAQLLIKSTKITQIKHNINFNQIWRTTTLLSFWRPWSNGALLYFMKSQSPLVVSFMMSRALRPKPVGLASARPWLCLKKRLSTSKSRQFSRKKQVPNTTKNRGISRYTIDKLVLMMSDKGNLKRFLKRQQNKTGNIECQPTQSWSQWLQRFYQPTLFVWFHISVGTTIYHFVGQILSPDCRNFNVALLKFISVW